LTGFTQLWHVWHLEG